MSTSAVAASLVVKARGGIQQGSDSTTKYLHVFGTRFPIAAVTAGANEITGVNKHTERY